MCIVLLNSSFSRMACLYFFLSAKIVHIVVIEKSEQSVHYYHYKAWPDNPKKGNAWYFGKFCALTSLRNRTQNLKIRIDVNYIR